MRRQQQQLQLFKMLQLSGGLREWPAAPVAGLSHHNLLTVGAKQLIARATAQQRLPRWQDSPSGGSMAATSSLYQGCPTGEEPGLQL